MTASTNKTARVVAATILTGVAAIAVLRVAAPATAAPVAPVVAKPAPAVAANLAAPAVAIIKPTPALATTVKPTPAAAPAAIAISRVIDTGGPIRYGSYFWDDAGVPNGPITITVDLKASVLSVFRGGYEIGTTAVIYGADDRETPLGTFPILQKDRHHFSSRYHHAPMPYMLRLTGDGVSIHASEIAANYATHGCIGVPAGFASKLFSVAKLGDRVTVTNQGMRADLNGRPPEHRLA